MDPQIINLGDLPPEAAPAELTWIWPHDHRTAFLIALAIASPKT